MSRTRLRGPVTALVFSFSFLCACTGEHATRQCAGGVEEESVDEAPICAAKVPPAPVLRRLTRSEYALTVRALLDTDEGVLEDLPEDVGTPFDTNAETLTFSPALFEKYELTSEQLLTKALLPVAQGGSGARERLLFCEPTPGDALPCAKEILESFGRSAWRKESVTKDVAPLLPVVEQALEKGVTLSARCSTDCKR